MAAVTSLLCVFGLGALLTGRGSAGEHCSSCQVGCSSTPNHMLYYKVMTPQWLQDHDSLNHLIAATPQMLHFKVNQARLRLIKVPLFQRGELPTDDITVTITVHLEDPPTSDSDFVTAICDGTIGNGVIMLESDNYPNTACNYATMNSGVTYTNLQSTGVCGAPITYTSFPNTATITFYPINKWASFSIMRTSHICDMDP